jgi:aminoglycoside phosphotransferase (APT) family kinase protein
MSQETMRAILWELGEQISRIHSIRPQDLGEGELLFENDVDEFFPREAEFLTLGGEAGLDRRALERAFRFVEAMEGSAEPSSMRLTHNDLRACHVLVHDGHLSGLIDFGQVSIASPVNELAKWAYWEEPSLPLAWLQEGYGDKSIFNETYPERLAAYRIVNALWVLRWYALTGYGEGVSRAAASIARYLSAIGPR